ncbi:T9SS type A sorting domain-containing protein [Flaviaesturariibacter aridisoli]|nr:T9SS type A sorting domain-containing protein [Flaviaesturariibacter aridisoli]
MIACLLSVVWMAGGAQCPNATDINATNVCGPYGDGAGNSFWNWELNDPTNPNYCGNWYAKTGPDPLLVRMGAPWVNAGSGKLKVIADEGDYTKAKGWELLLRKFGCQTDVANPYFVLYNRYTGLMRVFVYLPAQSTANYQSLLMAVKSVYDFRPATLADGSQQLRAIDKYSNNQALGANTDLIISIGESVGGNNWAVAEFYMMLDDNITSTNYANASLEVTIYGVTSNQLEAKVEGSSVSASSADAAANLAFKAASTPSVSSGGSFNYTATGERMVKLSKSLDEFVSKVHESAQKVVTSLSGKTGFLGALRKQAEGILAATDSKASFAKTFQSVSGFLGTVGQTLNMIGAVIGFFKDDVAAAASPTYTSYNLTISGTITAQVVVQKFVMKLPGTSAAPTNANNATYFNYPMGTLNLKVTPTADVLRYNRRALEPASASFYAQYHVATTVPYVAYRMRDNLQVVYNGGTGLVLERLEGALVAKVTNNYNTSDAQREPAQFGPLEWAPRRGTADGLPVGFYNHMAADVYANRLEVAKYDTDEGKYHAVQTAYYPLDCINKASMNIMDGIMTVSLRIRAVLRRADGQGGQIFFVRDFAIAERPGNPADIPGDISTNVSALPPYANYTLAPPATSYYVWSNFGTSLYQQPASAYYGYSSNYPFNSGGEFYFPYSIVTSGTEDFTKDFYTTINTTQKVTFRAGAYVLLNPKFEAGPGTNFEATVDWGYQNIPCTQSPTITSYSFGGNSYNTSIIAQRNIDELARKRSDVPAEAGLFPNPASDFVTVRLGNNESVLSVDLLDLNGRVLPVQTSGTAKTSVQLDLRRLPAGTYVVRVRTQQNVRTYSFVKTR